MYCLFTTNLFYFLIQSQSFQVGKEMIYQSDSQQICPPPNDLHSPTLPTIKNIIAKAPPKVIENTQNIPLTFLNSDFASLFTICLHFTSHASTESPTSSLPQTHFIIISLLLLFSLSLLQFLRSNSPKCRARQSRFLRQFHSLRSRTSLPVPFRFADSILYLSRFVLDP